jgi:hypothetical protein
MTSSLHRRMRVPSSLIFAGLFLVGFRVGRAEADPKPVEDKSPSRDKIQWLGGKTSLESTAQYDFVFNGKTDLGNSHHGHMTESEISLRQLITRRWMRAFLVRGGVEYESFAFHQADDSFLPGNLRVLNAYLAMDFRFSHQDLIRVQARPGVYTNNVNADMADFNTPVALAYSRMVSRGFQWALGLSINRWRRQVLLGGGGFRWQMSDRWKLKMMLPEPMVEYKAREDLHVFVGGDFRGDSFRLANDFGTRRGNPAFNNALVDYQEIRLGAGFSWNIKPLLELNFNTGYVLDRAFNYHNNGVLLTSGPAPYVSVNIQALFEMKNHEEPSLETKGPQFEVPDLERVLPNVPKIFDK